MPGNGFEAELQEGRNGAANLLHPLWCARPDFPRAEHFAVIFRIGWQPVTKNGAREQLLATHDNGQPEHEFVIFVAHDFGERKIQMLDVASDTVLAQPALEEPER